MIRAEHVDKLEILRSFLEHESGGPLPTISEMKYVFGKVMGVESDQLERLFEEVVGPTEAHADGRDRHD